MAQTYLQTISLGGGMSMMVGEYAHTLGAAENTQVIAAGKVYFVHVSPLLSSGNVDVNSNLYSTSTSGAITTITFRQLAGVTGGTFVIIYRN
jgi:hypothetical protein